MVLHEIIPACARLNKLTAIHQLFNKAYLGKRTSHYNIKSHFP